MGCMGTGDTAANGTWYIGFTSGKATAVAMGCGCGSTGCGAACCHARAQRKVSATDHQR